MAVKSKKRDKTARKPRAMQVDFTGVEGKKRARRIPEGDYLMKIKDYEVDHKKDDETSQFLKVYYTVKEGPTTGEWDEIFSFSKKALWKLRNFLEAVGFKIPSKAVNVPFEKLLGKEIAMTIADDEYEGKTKSQAVDYFPAADFAALSAADEDEDEDAEEAVTSDDEDEDEEEDEETEDSDDEDEDEDELELVDDDDI